MIAAMIARPRPGAGLLLWIGITVILLLLLARFGFFAADMAAAVRYPFELDYGEGIVWQQVDMIFDGRGFGDITRYPYIVFHYPPVYHAVVQGAALATGGDMLMLGRAVSLASTLAIMASIVWLSMSGDGLTTGKRGLLCGAVAALSLTLFPSILLWAPLMRVDMLALALSLAGMAAGIAAFERRNLVHVASLLFVLAVFTKQTSLAAPAALYAVMFVCRPRLAVAGIGSAVLLGLAILIPLALATDGGFLRHIFLYNINKFDLSRLSVMTLAGLGSGLPLIAITLWLSAARAARIRRALGPGARLAAVRARIAVSPSDRAFVTMLAYLATAGLIMVAVGKAGSNINYFNEFVCVLMVLFGMELRDLPIVATKQRTAAAGPGWSIVLVVLVAMLWLARDPLHAGRIERAVPAQRQYALAEQIRTAGKPVLSDDMVILRRAGVQVPWESAIFEELTSMGSWDERPFVAMVRSGAFAFVYTAGARGTRLFEGRYSPAVADAIDAAYPVKKRFGHWLLHYPPDPALPDIAR